MTQSSPNSSSAQPLSYKDAGVDIDAGDALVERIKPLAKKTMREGVLAGIGVEDVSAHVQAWQQEWAKREAL